MVCADPSANPQKPFIVPSSLLIYNAKQCDLLILWKLPSLNSFQQPYVHFYLLLSVNPIFVVA